MQLFRLARESNYVTVLSEGTVIGESGLVAVPIEDADTNAYRMEGSIHLLRNAYAQTQEEGPP